MRWPRGEWWFGAFRTGLLLNPFSYLVPLVRDPVYYGTLPPLQAVAIATALAAVSLVVGFAVFVKLEPRHIHHF